MTDDITQSERVRMRTAFVRFRGEWNKLQGNMFTAYDQPQVNAAIIMHLGPSSPRNKLQLRAKLEDLAVDFKIGDTTEESFELWRQLIVASTGRELEFETAA